MMAQKQHSVLVRHSMYRFDLLELMKDHQSYAGPHLAELSVPRVHDLELAMNDLVRFLFVGLVYALSEPE